MKKWLKIIFIFQSILFIATLLFLFTELNEISPIASMIGIVLLSPLGLLQFFLVKKNIENKRLKIYLIINGLSAFGIAVFAILHNLFYALSQMVMNDTFSKVIEYLGATLFIIAVLVCPVIFLASAIVSIIYYLKEKS